VLPVADARGMSRTTLRQPLGETLDAEIGRVLALKRLGARLTQESLAEAAGVSQSTIAKIERGSRTTTVATLEAVFAALQVRLHVSAEPLDAIVDVAIADLEAVPWPDRVERSGLGLLHRRLVATQVRHVFTGAAAALLHGVPLPVGIIDLTIEPAEMDAFWSAALARRRVERWLERFGDYSAFVPMHPREQGPARWRTSDAELRVEFVDVLPESIRLIVPTEAGEEIYEAVPMTEIELDDQAAGRMLRRYQERRAAQSPS